MQRVESDFGSLALDDLAQAAGVKDEPEAAFGEPLYGTAGWKKFMNFKQLPSLACFWADINFDKTTVKKIISSMEETFPQNLHSGSSSAKSAREAPTDAYKALMQSVKAPSNEPGALSGRALDAVACILWLEAMKFLLQNKTT